MNPRRLLPLLLLVPQGAGRPDPHFFRYQRPVDVAPSAAGRQTCVSLDAGVFAHASANLADLRLYRGGREIPYALSGADVPAPAQYPQPTVLNLGVRDGNVVFDAHLSHPSYSAIEIQTNARDFVAAVDVSGSQTSAATHATRLGTFTVFDLTRQGLTRSTVLHLPPSSFPYLHFTIRDPLRPEDITGVMVVATPERQPVYHTVGESRQVTRHGRYSVVTFVLPARVPVERVELSPAPTPANFSRDVVVKATSPQGATPTVFSGTIFRVHTERGAVRVDEEQDALDIPGLETPGDTGYVRWTVMIDHGDDVPLTLTSVRLAMRERRLCFDDTSGGGYVLYYGDSTLAAPRYDYARLFQSQDTAARAVLATEQPNPRYRPRPDTRPLTERHPAILWTALVLVVLLLGVLAMRTAAGVQPRGAA